MSLRRRLERSERLAAMMAGLAGRYLGFCNRTTRWQVEGQEALQAALAKGPVLLVMWHSRSIMGALHWPVQDGPLSSLYADSPIGRVSGALQARVGLQPMQMSDKLSNIAASRQVLRRVRAGVSIGMTGDGPLGPARVLKDAPLEWAKATGVPIFCYAFSTSRGRRLNAWDNMLVPKSFGKGAYVFRQVQGRGARRMTAAESAALAETLDACLNATMARADELAGVPPGP